MMRIVLLFGLSLLATAQDECPSPFASYHVHDILAKRAENTQIDDVTWKYQLRSEVLQDGYMPGKMYKFRLESGSSPDVIVSPYRSFIMEATPLDPEVSCGFGKFRLGSGIKIREGCPHIMINEHFEFKESVDFAWRAPECGCVAIRATVIPQGGEYFSDDDSAIEGPLTVTLCPYNHVPPIAGEDDDVYDVMDLEFYGLEEDTDDEDSLYALETLIMETTGISMEMDDRINHTFDDDDDSYDDDDDSYGDDDDLFDDDDLSYDDDYSYDDGDDAYDLDDSSDNDGSDGGRRGYRRKGLLRRIFRKKMKKGKFSSEDDDDSDDSDEGYGRRWGPHRGKGPHHRRGRPGHHGRHHFGPPGHHGRHHFGPHGHHFGPHGHHGHHHGMFKMSKEEKIEYLCEKMMSSSDDDDSDDDGDDGDISWERRRGHGGYHGKGPMKGDWHKKHMETMAECCELELLEDKVACYDKKKEEKYVRLCEKQDGEYPQCPFFGQETISTCCDMMGSDRYDCFNTSMIEKKQMWAGKAHLHRRYGRANMSDPVDRFNFLCARLANSKTDTSDISARKMKMPAQRLARWRERTDRKREAMQECCEMDQGAGVACMEENKRQHLDKLCDGEDVPGGIFVMEDDLNRCCPQQADERYSCFGEVFKNRRKSKRNVKVMGLVKKIKSVDDDNKRMDMVCRKLQLTDSGKTMKKKGFFKKMQSDDEVERWTEIFEERRLDMRECCAEEDDEDREECMEELREERFHRVCKGAEPLRPTTKMNSRKQRQFVNQCCELDDEQHSKCLGTRFRRGGRWRKRLSNLVQRLKKYNATAVQDEDLAEEVLEMTDSPPVVMTHTRSMVRMDKLDKDLQMIELVEARGEVVEEVLEEMDELLEEEEEEEEEEDEEEEDEEFWAMKSRCCGHGMQTGSRTRGECRKNAVQWAPGPGREQAVCRRAFLRCCLRKPGESIDSIIDDDSGIDLDDSDDLDLDGIQTRKERRKGKKFVRKTARKTARKVGRKERREERKMKRKGRLAGLAPQPLEP